MSFASAVLLTCAQLYKNLSPEIEDWKKTKWTSRGLIQTIIQALLETYKLDLHVLTAYY